MKLPTFLVGMCLPCQSSLWENNFFYFQNTHVLFIIFLPRTYLYYCKYCSNVFLTKPRVEMTELPSLRTHWNIKLRVWRFNFWLVLGDLSEWGNLVFGSGHFWKIVRFWLIIDANLQFSKEMNNEGNMRESWLGLILYLVLSFALLSARLTSSDFCQEIMISSEFWSVNVNNPGESRWD